MAGGYAKMVLAAMTRSLAVMAAMCLCSSHMIMEEKDGEKMVRCISA